MLLGEARSLGWQQFSTKYITPDAKYSLHDLLYAFGYEIVSPQHVHLNSLSYVARFVYDADGSLRKCLFLLRCTILWDNGLMVGWRG
jgi:hypothetical protein